MIAIGEIGLDYPYKREEQHRPKQHVWLVYQLNLARKMKLPVVLHVRDAHEDALRIRKWPPARKLGGVIHCFYGSKEIAEQYLKLGYHIGIGSSVLQLKETGKGSVGSDSTDPIGTYFGRDRCHIHTALLQRCDPAQTPPLCPEYLADSPAVIKKIAELNGVSLDEVERATTENTIRLFSLSI